jgi:hypothetical protein
MESGELTLILLAVSHPELPYGDRFMKRRVVMHGRRSVIRLLILVAAINASLFTDYGTLVGGTFMQYLGRAVAYGAPSVSSIYPVSNATGVELNRWIKATFSEAMNDSTITTSTFRLEKILPASVTVTVTKTDGTSLQNTLSYTSSPFAGIYKGTYTGGAGGDFITGVAGNREMRGFAFSNYGVDSFNCKLTGSSPPWSFSAISGKGSQFRGTATAGSTSGSWQNPQYSGNFSGTKVFGNNGSGYNKDVYTASDSYWVTVAEVSGNDITGAVVNNSAPDLYWGYGTVDADGHFTIPSINSYRNGLVASATGTLNQSRVAVSGTVGYHAARYSAYFIPTSNLEPNTTYRATVSKTVRNANGVQMESDYTWSFTTGSSLLKNLTVTFAGDGSGSVFHNVPSPGFTCISRTCTAQLGSGGIYTLTAEPNSNSIFEGWSGECATNSGNICTVSMNADRRVTATFNLALPVRILNASYYESLQDAFDGVTAQVSTIQARAMELTGDLSANRGKEITLAGGYNSNFTDNSGYTVMDGILTISHGSLTVENLVIR